MRSAIRARLYPKERVMTVGSEDFLFARPNKPYPMSLCTRICFFFPFTKDLAHTEYRGTTRVLPAGAEAQTSIQRTMYEQPLQGSFTCFATALTNAHKRRARFLPFTI